jgi:hypothetical protein
MYFKQGLVYRKDNQFYELEYPNYGKEIDLSDKSKYEYAHDFLTLKNDNRLKPEFEKAMGVTACYHVDFFTEDEGVKKGFYYLIVEDKPGVFYIIRCKSNEEKRKVLDGNFAAEFERLLNVFSHNRTDMPAYDVAISRAIEIANEYYKVQESESKLRFDEANAFRSKFSGKIVLRNSDDLNGPEVKSITMKGNEKVYIFFYPSDGKQQTYNKKKFSIRVKGNSKSAEFELPYQNVIGHLTKRGYGGNYFYGLLFEGHTNELGSDMYNRDSKEYASSLQNYFVINTVNLLKLKGGFSGIIQVELMDEDGVTISSGSYTLNVPANEYHGDNDLCFIPSWSRHDAKLEAAMKSAYLQRNPKLKDVSRIIINDKEWRVFKNGGVIKGRLMCARVIYSTTSGSCFSHTVDFYSVYDYRSQTFSDILSLDKEYKSPRPIACDCDL